MTKSTQAALPQTSPGELTPRARILLLLTAAAGTLLLYNQELTASVISGIAAAVSNPHINTSDYYSQQADSDTPSLAPPSEHACGRVFREQLRIRNAGAPVCSPRELFDAMRAARRPAKDAPLTIGGCANLHWMEPPQACDVLQRANMLMLVGDSLTRHLMQALLTVLAGDYENTTAAMGNKADPPEARCSCDRAYDEFHRPGVPHSGNTEKYCRTGSIAHQTWSIARARELMPGFCPSWQRMHVCLSSVCAGPLPLSGIAFIAGGLHYSNLSSPATIESVFSDGGAHGEAAGGKGAPMAYRHICSTLHAPGENKGIKYLRSHGMGATVPYNQMIVKLACPRLGDAHFDAFAATLNASSIDGQHYYQEANILLAQLLLNLVAAMIPPEATGARNNHSTGTLMA